MDALQQSVTRLAGTIRQHFTDDSPHLHIKTRILQFRAGKFNLARCHYPDIYSWMVFSHAKLAPLLALTATDRDEEGMPATQQKQPPGLGEPQ